LIKRLPTKDAIQLDRSQKNRPTFGLSIFPKTAHQGYRLPTPEHQISSKADTLTPQYLAHQMQYIVDALNCKVEPLLPLRPRTKREIRVQAFPYIRPQLPTLVTKQNRSQTNQIRNRLHKQRQKN